jgi:hypothetical protein
VIQGLAMRSRLVSTTDPPVSASKVLGLQVCTTIPGHPLLFISCVTLDKSFTSLRLFSLSFLE